MKLTQDQAIAFFQALGVAAGEPAAHDEVAAWKPEELELLTTSLNAALLTLVPPTEATATPPWFPTLDDGEIGELHVAAMHSWQAGFARVDIDPAQVVALCDEVAVARKAKVEGVLIHPDRLRELERCERECLEARNRCAAKGGE